MIKNLTHDQEKFWEKIVFVFDHNNKNAIAKLFDEKYLICFKSSKLGANCQNMLFLTWNLTANDLILSRCTTYVSKCIQYLIL